SSPPHAADRSSSARPEPTPPLTRSTDPAGRRTLGVGGRVGRIPRLPSYTRYGSVRSDATGSAGRSQTLESQRRQQARRAHIVHTQALEPTLVELTAEESEAIRVAAEQVTADPITDPDAFGRQALNASF